MVATTHRGSNAPARATLLRHFTDRCEMPAAEIRLAGIPIRIEVEDRNGVGEPFLDEDLVLFDRQGVGRNVERLLGVLRFAERLICRHHPEIRPTLPGRAPALGEWIPDAAVAAAALERDHTPSRVVAIFHGPAHWDLFAARRLSYSKLVRNRWVVDGPHLGFEWRGLEVADAGSKREVVVADAGSFDRSAGLVAAWVAERHGQRDLVARLARKGRYLLCPHCGGRFGSARIYGIHLRDVCRDSAAACVAAAGRPHQLLEQAERSQQGGRLPFPGRPAR